MRKRFLLGFVLLTGISAFSQNYVTGKLLDTANKQPLYMATATVYKAIDTSLINFRLSNDNGIFKVTTLPHDVPLRLIISYSGYKVYKKDFLLTDQQPQIDLGNIYLTKDTAMLEEVLVVAERPPMVVRRDTVEFNAAAFKTLPNALVEDLLKKLPGVQVDNKGGLLVNGKPVNRILVDGKSFFGNDPKMATRNLPANLIDKIQVTDDKEELLRNGDDNINNVGKVINLTFKKGVKKGWFGKAYAGLGTQDRYEAGAIANIFRDTLQVSLLGYINNLNRPGFSFSDIMQTGGMQRSNSMLSNNSMSINSNGNGSSININGINFGGYSNEGGVSTSRGAGININHSPNNKQSIFGQYFFGNVETKPNIRSITQLNMGDTISTFNSQSKSTVITNAHSMSIGANLKPDSTTNIMANASYMVGLTKNDKQTSTNNETNYLGKISTGNVTLNNDDISQSYSQFFSYNKLSKQKAGRKFTITQILDYDNKRNTDETNSLVNYLYPSAFDSTLHQRRKEKIPELIASLGANYSEPLSKKWYLRFGSKYEYGKLKTNINTYNIYNNQQETINPLLSSSFNRSSSRLSATAGLEYRYKYLTITPSMRLLTQKFENIWTNYPSVLQRQTNLLPQLQVVYKRLTFNYNRDVVLPSYGYLIPVPNNTNPYYTYVGSPSLLPSVKDQFSVNANFYDPKRSLNVYAYASASVMKNGVSQDITMNSQGMQTIKYINVNGLQNHWVNFNVNKEYKNNQKRIFTWYVGGYASYNKNQYYFNKEKSVQTRTNINSWGGFSISWNDEIEWNNTGYFGIQTVKNTNTFFKNIQTTDKSAGTEFIIRKIKHLIFETKFDYNVNSNIVDTRYRDYFVWNAAVNFTMLKDEKGVLKLGVYDLLNQTNNVYVSSSQNRVTTTYDNVIGRYVMLTFTYNIRAVGAKKKVGGSFLLF